MLILFSFLFGCAVTSIFMFYRQNKIVYEILSAIINNLSDMFYEPNEVPEEDKSMADGYNCALDYVINLLEEARNDY